MPDDRSAAAGSQPGPGPQDVLPLVDRWLDPGYDLVRHAGRTPEQAEAAMLDAARELVDRTEADGPVPDATAFLVACLTTSGRPGSHAGSGNSEHRARKLGRPARHPDDAGSAPPAADPTTARAEAALVAAGVGVLLRARDRHGLPVRTAVALADAGRQPGVAGNEAPRDAAPAGTGPGPDAAPTSTGPGPDAAPTGSGTPPDAPPASATQAVPATVPAGMPVTVPAGMQAGSPAGMPATGGGPSADDWERLALARAAFVAEFDNPGAESQVAAPHGPPDGRADDPAAGMLAAYADRALRPGRAVAVRRHADGCPACDALLDAQLRARHIVAALPLATLAPADRRRLLAEVDGYARRHLLPLSADILAAPATAAPAQSSRLPVTAGVLVAASLVAGVAVALATGAVPTHGPRTIVVPPSSPTRQSTVPVVQPSVPPHPTPSASPTPSPTPTPPPTPSPSPSSVSPSPSASATGSPTASPTDTPTPTVSTPQPSRNPRSSRSPRPSPSGSPLPSASPTTGAGAPVLAAGPG